MMQPTATNLIFGGVRVGVVVSLFHFAFVCFL